MYSLILSATDSRADAIGADRVSYNFVIWFSLYLVIFIIGFLFDYIWFVAIFETYIYFHKPTPIKHQHRKISNGNFFYSLLLFSILLS